MCGVPASQGFFITFEGGEGSGKSSQAARLAAYLVDAGRDVVTTREPGGSSGAELIRNLLLDRSSNFDGLTETLLFFAARRDHLKTIIKPHISTGGVVICDRFSDSTYAYQGAAGKTQRQVLDSLQSMVVGMDGPDLTIILDIDPMVGLRRAASRRRAGEGADRFEAESVGFHRLVRQAFLDIAANDPRRCTIIDASRSADEVSAEIQALVSLRLHLTEMAKHA